jgi:hypothetical protein
MNGVPQPRRRDNGLEFQRQREPAHQEHGLIQSLRAFERRDAECDPGEDDRKEGDRRREEGDRGVDGTGHRAIFREMRPDMRDDEVGAMQRTPDDEGPGRTMPEAADQHDDPEIGIAADRAFSISAERNVDVIAQETRQRHVPAPPEFDDVARLVGRIEIGREFHAEHARQANRHVGIAREIEIDLEGVGKGPRPGDEEMNVLVEIGTGKNRRREGAQRVGNQTFLGEADGQEQHAAGDVFPDLCSA